MQKKRPYYTYNCYRSWETMKNRCYQPKHNSYHNYGGRGIKVCDRWLESFENFLEDMGEKPSKEHSLDRIDNDGDYTPENCKWSTRKEQSRNMRTNVRLTAGGRTQTVAEWAEEFGETYNTFASRYYKRIEQGWSMERAVLTPPTVRHRSHKGKSLKQVSQETGINYGTLIGRQQRGWGEDCLTQKVGSQRQRLGRPTRKNKTKFSEIEFQGRVQSLSEWAKELGIPYSSMRTEIIRGRTMEEIDKMYSLIK